MIPFPMVAIPLPVAVVATAAVATAAVAEGLVHLGQTSRADAGFEAERDQRVHIDGLSARAVPS